MLVRCPSCKKNYDAPTYYAQVDLKYYLTCGDCWKKRSEHCDSIIRTPPRDGESNNQSGQD